MKRRIYAAVLSVLLAVSLVLSLPVTAKADSWEDTIAQYDRLFAATDEEPAAKFKELYNALLLDPTTFVNQLAFRNKDVKEYVLYILTGEWVSDESLQTMSALVYPIQSMPEITMSEKELSEYQKEMTDIIGLMDTIGDSDFEYNPIDMSNAVPFSELRADKVETFDNMDGIVKNGPQVIEHQFVVPKIVD